MAETSVAEKRLTDEIVSLRENMARQSVVIDKLKSQIETLHRMRDADFARQPHRRPGVAKMVVPGDAEY